MAINIAVIGAGTMGEDHAKIVAESLTGCSLQVVCDVDRDRARSVADQYGAHDIELDPERAIARSDVDVAIIASPDFTHAAASLTCIQSGKMALCEKPLSQSSRDCIEVMSAEQKAGKKFIQLGFMRRYDQSYVEMRQALADGMLGRALMMHNFHRNVETPNADFTGAMAITNSAPHEFDIARHVLTSEFSSVSAFQPKRSDHVVAPVVMVLETSDDQLVTIEINNNAAYGYDVRAELVGEKGSISSTPVSFSRLDTKLASATKYETDWRDRYHDAYVRQNRAFLKFVESGEFPEQAASCWDGYCAAIVAEAGVQALSSGGKTNIAMIDKPGFYQ